jgi:LCP family protein required for cell wall assembly
MPPSPTGSRTPGALLRRAAAAIALAVVVAAAFPGLELWAAWRSIERVEFDPGAARDALPSTTSTPVPVTTTTTAPGGDPATTTTSTTTTIPPLPEDLTTFLVVGEDSKSDPRYDEIIRADALMLAAVSESTGRIGVLSIPRNLVVPDPCSGAAVQIQELVEGCGEAVSGGELLAIAVEDLLGISVDHFVVLGFESFELMIDTVGGLDLCLPHDFSPAPDQPLVAEAGCRVRDGATVLTWIRSRTGLERIDGEWVAMTGGDVARSERQRDVLIGLFLKLKAMRNPADLTAIAEELAPNLNLDDGLDLGQVVGLAWRVRSLGTGAISAASLPVEQQATEAGLIAVAAGDPGTFAREVFGG